MITAALRLAMVLQKPIVHLDFSGNPIAIEATAI
jgi:hypothetical protein